LSIALVLGCFVVSCTKQTGFGNAAAAATMRRWQYTIDASGNIYSTGYFSLFARFDTTLLASSGGGDVFVVKQNAGGNIMWAVKAGGSNSDRGTSIATDALGNVYVCGYFQRERYVRQHAAGLGK
jgi:hypothetical protein